MKKQRCILPAILLPIALLAILLVIMSKKERVNAAQNETVVDHWTDSESTAVSTGSGSMETASPTASPADSTITPEAEHVAGDSPVAETTTPSYIPTKDEFFADTLFIGDSRTVGLQDYAELETATFFAYSGLSSFSAFKKTLDVPGIGKTTLETLLTSQHYGKIYLMLGINELGYPLSSIRSQYTHVATKIRELHPHAQIILCANLRVVADGKEKRDYVANETINQVNEHIASLADNETFFYVDANPLFDDGNGALDPQYCADDLHPYGKYYYQWGEWLYEVGITPLQ